MKSRILCSSLLVLLATWSLAACRAAEDASAPVATPLPDRDPPANILLITIDTLRVDALGSYGNDRGATPWMDRLAAAGVRFTNAYAHNVVTLPSHANLLSGRYPQEHGVRDNSGFRFPDALPTLATVLRQEGYRTAAFISAFPLDSRFGLARDFEVYEDSFIGAGPRPTFLEQERAGPETVALAKDWIDSADGRPWFAWLHLYEPHFPYAPPEPFRSRFADDPYLGDVAASDAALEPLLAPLLDRKIAGETLVVLTSDHGESLGEHGEATHGIFAYQNTLQVPLILYGPPSVPTRIVDQTAQHIDILPTILDFLALSVPEGLLGRSLLPAVRGESAQPFAATAYFEALSGQLNRGWAPLHGIIEGSWKYIDLPIPELYDLTSDPLEQDNLASRESKRTAAMRSQLRDLLALDRGVERQAEDADVRERLRSLGYLSDSKAPKASYTEQDDPKRLIALDGVLREVAGLYDQGDLAGALTRARQLVQQRPGMRIALLSLAHLERQSGNLERAIEALREAWVLQPGDGTTLALLASYLTQAGRPAEAVEITAAHEQLEFPEIDVLTVRALALARLDRSPEAFATLDTARSVDPRNPAVPIHAGTLHLMHGNRDAARAAFREALTINPNAAAAHTALAVMATEDGDLMPALDHWRRAVESDPQQLSRLLIVGSGLWNSGRQAIARPLFELFLELAPREAYENEIVRLRSLLATPE